VDLLGLEILENCYSGGMSPKSTSSVHTACGDEAAGGIGSNSSYHLLNPDVFQPVYFPEQQKPTIRPMLCLPEIYSTALENRLSNASKLHELLKEIKKPELQNQAHQIIQVKGFWC
jgi:hypothetical protein